MKKFAKLAIVLALALTLVIGVTACGSDDEKTDKTYVAAMEATFPPFDTTNKDGDLDGFDYALINAIAKDQGLKVEWKKMEFDGLIPALKSGNINIIASGLSITDERKEEVDFSDSYYDSGLLVAVIKDSKITSIDDLGKNSIVGVQIGTSGAKKAESLKKDGKIGKVKTYNGLDVAFKDLENGGIDAIINDKPVTDNYVSKSSDKVKTVGDVIDADSYGIAVKKGETALLEKINAGLKNLKDNGKYDELIKKLDTWKQKDK